MQNASDAEAAGALALLAPGIDVIGDTPISAPRSVGDALHASDVPSAPFEIVTLPRGPDTLGIDMVIVYARRVAPDVQAYFATLKKAMAPGLSTTTRGWARVTNGLIGPSAVLLHTASALADES